MISLDVDSELQDVHWWGSYAGRGAGARGRLRLQLFADVGSAPDRRYSVGLGEVGRVDTGDTDAAGNRSTSTGLTAVNHPEPSVTYHLSIANDTSESIATGCGQLPRRPSGSGTTCGKRRHALVASNGSPNLAFNLTGEPLNGGPHPEPATVAARPRRRGPVAQYAGSQTGDRGSSSPGGHHPRGMSQDKVAQHSALMPHLVAGVGQILNANNRRATTSNEGPRHAAQCCKWCVRLGDA